MLISWIVLAIGQLSAAGLPVIDLTTAATSQPIARPITPGEPSTLAEALISAGLIAAYVVMTRRLRAESTTRQIFSPKHTDSGRKAA